MTWEWLWDTLREMIKELWLAGWMLVWSGWDLRHRVICLWQVILVLAVGLIWQGIEGVLFTGAVCSGLALGGGALAFSLMTEDRFGCGDAMAILCLGLYLGFSRSLSALMWGLLVASVVSLYLILVKKRSMQQSIPFIPCLTAGYVILLGIGLVAG